MIKKRILEILRNFPELDAAVYREGDSRIRIQLGADFVDLASLAALHQALSEDQITMFLSDRTLNLKSKMIFLQVEG